MNKTGKLNGTPSPLQIVFFSENLNWDSNRNSTENWPKEPNIERDKINTHSLVWHKYNKDVLFFFKSASTNRIKPDTCKCVYYPLQFRFFTLVLFSKCPTMQLIFLKNDPISNKEVEKWQGWTYFQAFVDLCRSNG